MYSTSTLIDLVTYFTFEEQGIKMTTYFIPFNIAMTIYMKYSHIIR